jgi:hypothetical protein
VPFEGAQGTFGSLWHQFDPVTNIVSRFGLGEIRMVPRDMGQYDHDDLIVSSAAGDVAAFASDLPEHESPLRTYLNI